MSSKYNGFGLFDVDVSDSDIGPLPLVRSDNQIGFVLDQADSSSSDSDIDIRSSHRIGIDDTAKVTLGPSRSPQFRHFCWTLNNPVEEDKLNIASIKCRYVCYQHEVGANGTPHLQGFISFKDTKTNKSVIKLFKRTNGTNPIHCEPKSSKSTMFEAIDYCLRESKRSSYNNPNMTILFPVYERGQKPQDGQGSRSDLCELTDFIKTRKTSREIFEKFPGHYLKYGKMIERACTFYDLPRAQATEVYWFYGPTGTGKSRECLSLAPGAYWKNSSNKWWCGYHFQDVVIDDMRKDFMKFHEMLNLFDRYPLQLETKGGQITFNSNRIFITCPQHPDEMYADRRDEDKQQLIRRIHEIRYFPAAVPASKFADIFSILDDII